MTGDVDFHVGLVKGYMLALNAPTQILHALEVLLTDYRSRAGEVIGKAAPSPAAKPAPVSGEPAMPLPRHLPIVQDDEPEEDEHGRRTRTVWTEEMIDKLRSEKRKGSSVVDIARTMGLSPQQVYTKINHLKNIG